MRGRCGLCDMGAHVFRKKLGMPMSVKENPNWLPAVLMFTCGIRYIRELYLECSARRWLSVRQVSLSLHAELYILPMRQSRRKTVT